MLDLDRFRGIAATTPRAVATGRITRVIGLTVEVRGLRVAMGEICELTLGDGRRVLAEVVGFREGSTQLMPLDEARGIAPGDRVRPIKKSLAVDCSEALLGRVVDALGRPLDDGPPLPSGVAREAFANAPSPLKRRRIDTRFDTGISTLDGLLTVGRGQRLGIFAGSGVGKSTLLGSMARNGLAEVNVIALIGERGREVAEFLEESLGPEGLARSVVVVATSDAPPLLRFKAAFTAMAIAEHFRDLGREVLMMMDSVTRLANSAREIGLALGEPPTVKGYPPSFFGVMPKLVERMGRIDRGSITGILTVLVDADDMNEPVADTMRGLLDGHIVLSRKVASRGQYPAIDVLESVSRVMSSVVSSEEQEAARLFRESLAVFEDARDLVAVGALKRGADPVIDAAVAAHPKMLALMKQGAGECRSLEQTQALLLDAVRAAQPRGGLGA